MLIEFVVENFRSIKDPIRLSAVAQKQRHCTKEREGIKSDNEIAKPYYFERRNLEILPVLAIFGANASGKSNVLLALDSLLRFMVLRQLFYNEEWVEPFLLNSVTAQSPIRFELQVLAENSIYHYELAYLQDRIISEKLEYLPEEARGFRLLYSSLWNPEEQIYDWENGRDFTGPLKRLQPSWVGSEPFLRALSKDFSSQIVSPLIKWLSQYRHLVTPIDTRFLFRQFRQSPNLDLEVADFMRQFDTGLSDIIVEEDKEKRKYRIMARHETDSGTIDWDFNKESQGTKSLFSIVSRIIRALKVGGSLIIDEFGSDIHPNITHRIVEIFQSEKTNPHRAQLIFATHDSTLQSHQLLRRDQIWFTQKNKENSTELYALSDFKPRNDLDIQRPYLDGRYGGVPILPSQESLLGIIQEVSV